MSSRELRVALATSADVPKLTADDHLLAAALATRGVRAEPAIWSDPDEEWASYDAVVIRSCWDYHKRHDEFLAWVSRIEGAAVSLFNPPALVRWNSEKSYLRDLAAAGVSTVPTHWVERGDTVTLPEIMTARGWRDVVIKPAISASAHDTWRASMTTVRDSGERFRRSVAAGRLLVQPFLPVVQEEGEWSLLFYGGEYSHAALKRPAVGDFRVQREHGGSSEAARPHASVIDDASAAMRAAVDGRPAALYARVDGCVVDGTFLLMELELIEPDLFLRDAGSAPAALADALLHSLR